MLATHIPSSQVLPYEELRSQETLPRLDLLRGPQPGSQVFSKDSSGEARLDVIRQPLAHFSRKKNTLGPELSLL